MGKGFPVESGKWGVGVSAMGCYDFPMAAKRFDRLGMYRLIADRIENDPGLLQIGLENIDRWIANGSDQPLKLEEWRGRILAAQHSKEDWSALLALLREDAERAEFERNFAPFAGVLTAADRRPFILECSYAH